MRECFNQELKFELSHSDYEHCQQHCTELPETLRPRVVAAIDEVILRLAEEHGTRIEILPEVMRRINGWELEGDKGADLHQRLAKKFKQRTILNAGKGKAPLF